VGFVEAVGVAETAGFGAVGLVGAAAAALGIENSMGG